ncbi:nose resistant to fluoxetine protein 6-like [Saccostrea cucullata]|uniref:nose resistant to fluoxetine protein 6-like n=1 Tax=Saccostrea cuccullata TaxID=36930 RepID=UPI002ED670E5
MSWVILGHTWAFTATSQFGSNFGPYVSNFFKRRSAQAILNALFSVDTFFVLSGLLTSYLTLKQMSKVKGKINWFLFYFHRFWRLTPAYMMLIAVAVGVAHHVVNGPNAPKPDTVCPKYWWWNLLYINNFVDSSANLCLGWSWYLNNDMQFYILSPAMIVPLFFKDIIGIISCGIFLAATTITTGVLSHHYSWNPLVVGGGKHPGGDVFKDYYIKPYCRMGPYICGIFTGYLLYKFKNKCQINIFVNLGIWGVATACASAALYGLYDAFNGHPLSNEVSSLYNALSRTVWGAAVCWVIFACATGNGGPINTILSWKVLVPLSRLTYCAYLVHPLIIYAYNGSHPQTIYLSDIDLIYKFIANLVISYGVALVFSISFESPFMGLEKVLLSGFSQKK